MKTNGNASFNPGEFGSYDPGLPRYRGLLVSSQYLEMDDGVRLAAEIILPKGLQSGDRLPALLVQSRYWRTIELRSPLNWFWRAEDMNPNFRDQQPFFTSHGYAIVVVDVRGTGASFGTWSYPWHRQTLDDARQVVDWIITQPWSNGRVGAFGISYLGTTAELLTTLEHPAVRAVIPQFNHPDAYTDIAFPGGLFDERFIRSWGYFDKHLDNNILPAEFGWSGRLMFRGVKPVDDDRDRSLMRAAVRSHAQNGNSYLLAKDIVYRDQVSAEIGASIDEMTVHYHRDRVVRSPALTCGWASWMDAGTADAALRRFLTFPGAVQAVIGAWEHGGRFNASPYRPTDAPASPPLPGQWREMLRFYDALLKDGAQVEPPEKMLYYYTMGEECWKSSRTWPPAGIAVRRWYLSSNHALAPAAPAAAEQGLDRYTVDFDAVSANYNRWWEMAVLEYKTVSYPDRAEQDHRLLTYTSAPLEQDMEITGYPVVGIYLNSTTTDGALIVYLEDVAPDGTVYYITEGQLRLIHRKVSPPEESPYCLQVPYHSFKEADARPMVPGAVVEVTFGLNPVSVLVRRGHCLRLAIAGADKGTFTRVPEQGVPVYEVYFQEGRLSFIDLPSK